MKEDEMVRQYQQLNRHEFEQALGDSKRQGSLRATVCEVAKSWTRLSTEQQQNIDKHI